MNPGRVLAAGLLIFTSGQLHAQSGYPWYKVDTVTSGLCDDFNPVMISNDGRWQTQGPVRMIFDRQTTGESQIVARTFRVAPAAWGTSELTISRSPVDQPQKKPAYAEAVFSSPGTPARRIAMAAWQHWTGTRWEIRYSSLPAPDSAWSVPAPLVSDSVDNTDARIQPIRDSLFIVTWRRGCAIMALFKTPAGTIPAETLAVGIDDSSGYDLSSRPNYHATLIWTTRVDGIPNPVFRFVDWRSLESALPETLRTPGPCNNPRLLTTWAGDPFFLYETRVQSTLQVYHWGGPYSGLNISSDEAADNLRGGAYMVPVITKSAARLKGTFYPFNMIVYEKIRPGDSALVFLPPWGQGDTIRTPGYNRKASVGSTMIWTAPDLNVVVVWESNRSGRSHIYSRLVRVYVGAVDDPPGNPSGFTLTQNYPNPFNPSTVIRYRIPVTAEVTLRVFNLLGQSVATLVHEKQGAGEHEVRFGGVGLASGVYFYRLQVGNLIETRKMVITR